MIGKSVSHYEILDKLGGGGMGVVYKARDSRLDRLVALKFLPPHLGEKTSARERFIQEAKAASALDHRNICAVHDIDVEDGQLFIAMAYYPGRTLRTQLEEGPLEVGHALDIVIQMAEGLACAHEAGIVHRDVKPANVILTDRGEVKVVDFGLAKVPDKNMTESGTLMGTPAYMSPEQVRGEKVDARTDVWSLGVVLFEMLKGEPPFRAETKVAIIRAIENEKTPALEGVPEELATIVRRALQKERASRYASMNELVEELREARLALGFSDSGVTLIRRPMGRELRRPRYTVVALLIVAAITTMGYLFYQHSARARWARREALPEIERLADAMSPVRDGTYAWSAYELALKADEAIPEDPVLERLWPRITLDATIQSEPPGATVSAKPYAKPEAEWVTFGQTPLEARMPLGFARLKLEKEGFRTVYELVWIAELAWSSSTWSFALPDDESLPEDMVRFPGGTDSVWIAGIDHVEPETFAPFLMDRYEVTNREFERFVDAGGYENAEFWTEPFVREGQHVSWDEAIESFKDKTGRPGPATWEVGDYPRGQGNYPVSGVSWYEAAAYARFAGKSLPTIFHWSQAAFTFSAGEVVPLSNFHGNGPAEVGASGSMNRMGTHDVAGNVREWCSNATARERQRFILGGGWNDPPYAFTDSYAQSPWDRSSTNGFRCIRYAGAEPNAARLEREIELPFRNFFTEEVVSDETFEVYLSQYAYDRNDLAATVDAEREDEDWKVQKVSFNAAYGGERMLAYLFLPKGTGPPYQTLIYFPGAGDIRSRSSERFMEGQNDERLMALVKSKRAVMYPIYKGTHERGDALKSDYPDETIFYKDHVIMWVKDFSRSIDYLETREDIDAEKLAYFGTSWGGHMGAIIPAVEKRIKTSVLYVAGMYFQSALPEVDAINYVSRITHPVLMLNGEYDFFFPLETSQRPMFERLGTPEKDKKWLVYPGSHYVPQTEFVRETLDWLDAYLGPVQ